jgi:ACS family tartrate transporter-like MFS transporter
MESIPQIATTELVQATAVRKAKIKILPFIFLLYINAYLDRVNVSFAALNMTKDLNFTSDVFGFGSGIFFLGYFLLEIPGTWIVERWSARKWMARIMISWGILTIFMGFISTARQFYIIRFLIGLAEAGFFPGMIVYLSHWFTARERAQAVAIFMSAIPISNIVAGPISGAILNLSAWGLAGWRWLFILEGIPAVIFGVLTLFVLVDWPRHASWLTED